jgi:hypothetical protein
MALPKIKVKCLLCDAEFQMGPDMYGGHWIPRYKMHVCSSCYQSNWDGYANQYDARILANLKSEQLDVPPRNSRGYLPRD